MKKLWILGLAVLMAVALAAPAQAAINGTAHANTLTRGTVEVAGCAQCHLPHAGQGNRLWPVSPVSAANVIGAVAPLCGYCHHSTGAAVALGGQQDLLWQTESHGVQMIYTDDANGYVVSIGMSALPYTAAANGRTNTFIECTSCHNVHDDTDRPFLQESLDVICARCHQDRHFVGGALSQGAAPAEGAWAAAYFGTGNPGSHPVGTDVTGNVFEGDTPITIPAYMGFADGGSRGWSLGGKRTGWAAAAETGGVACYTCHAAHGMHADAQDTSLPTGIVANDTQGPFTNFLARDQNAPGDAGRGDGRSVANGAQDYNGLCEACHVGTIVDATDYPSANGDYDSTTNFGRIAQNPGGSSWGHPVDNMDVLNQAWVTSFPANWPTGNITNAGLTAPTLAADPVVICESCHGPHPFADAAEADYSGSTEFILRNTLNNICNDCHGTSNPTATNHHPIGRTYDQTNLAYLNLDAGETLLSCGTCHGGGGGGAHNWTDAGSLGMRTGWLPTDNARGATYDVNMGITCMDCHYQLTGSRRLSPTLNNGIQYVVEANYVTIGNGSHYIGSIAAGAAYWTGQGGSKNAYAETWNADDGFSRFGGSATNPVFVCESCHELQPSMNDGNVHLLLSPMFEEDGDSRNSFCEGCHYPTGTHPVSNTIVSRTGALLSTNTAAEWLSTPTDTNVVLRAGDELNCDSCHQVHDAESDSWTFILDTADANVGPVSVFDPKPTAGNYTAAYASTVATSPGGDTTSFCNECHPYE